MKRRSLLLITSLLFALAGCGTAPATEAPTQAPTAAPTRTPRPSATAAPTLAPEATATLPPPVVVPTAPADTSALATMTAELSATVVASLPPTPTPDQANGTGGFGLEGASAQALRSPQGWPQLWAVASHGMSMGDPTQTHFVAIYTREGDNWKQLDRFELTDDDYLDPTGLAQVDVEPSNIWLEAQGGAGAHSGCYDLLRFDGSKLHSEVSSCSSSPGGSRLEDINGDGTLDVVLDATDYYVFCYACGVRKISYTVLRWDGQKMAEVKLAPLPAAQPGELYNLTSQAITLAQAGLWKDAEAAISQTVLLQQDNPDALWAAGLIRLTATARAEQAQSGAYPLLDSLFYGDYPAVLNLMRAHKLDELWSAEPPLVQGTTAESWEQQVTDEITQTTDLALATVPDLAAAYFLRGWGVHLTDPTNPSVLADVERAAQLDPNEILFKQSLEYLRK
jgi:hypothetical protein